MSSGLNSVPPSDQAKYLVSSNGFSQHSDAEKNNKRRGFVEGTR